VPKRQWEVGLAPDSGTGVMRSSNPANSGPLPTRMVFGLPRAPTRRSVTVAIPSRVQQSTMVRIRYGRPSVEQGVGQSSRPCASVDLTIDGFAWSVAEPDVPPFVIHPALQERERRRPAAPRSLAPPPASDLDTNRQDDMLSALCG
jgi:hypothetical protein